jgi:hypothetical protein
MKENGLIIYPMAKDYKELVKIFNSKVISLMGKNKEKEFLILETVTNILVNLKIIKFVDKANTQLHKMNGKELGKMDT